MNKEESLALYEKGVEAWNAWANEMLAKKAELEENKQWQIDANGKGINEVTREWINNSNVNFSNPNHIFDKKVDFSDFIFPYSVNFREVTFSGEAWFNNAKFNGDTKFDSAKFNDATRFIGAEFNGLTRFIGAEFNDSVRFNDASFSGTTWFGKASFSDNAWFNNAKFKGAVWFSRASFSGYTDLSDVKFRGKTYFMQASFGGSVDFNQTTFESISVFAAIDGKGHFSFRYTEFHLAPDFNQAHFTEAPQFDNSDFSRALQTKEINLSFSSSWRALKRLAIQGHDQERELIFFAAEIKSLRGKEDKAFPQPLKYLINNNNDALWPGGSRYWFGYFYQCFSDFGRSIMRPLSWWLGLGALFLFLYLKYPIDAEPQATVSCDRTEAALYLSVRNALPFLPATGYSENLSRSYAYLYGKHSDGKENVPNAIVFISIFQTILSTILIFLLLLALRNHFRIK
ncbi:MAG: hypothetical protein DU489_12295 [Nitrosomonas sp.]|uniref:pentapeptide repeat-containing protein n=1 Tax=Nitrosomonas sp. TaxID=42353 RepID=UPI0032EDD5AB